MSSGLRIDEQKLYKEINIISYMLGQKRGLSDVITVTLIILLAVSAVAIVWTFVRGTIEDVGQQVSASCTTVNIKATKCDISDNKITVEAGSGKNVITKVRLLVLDAAGNTVSSSTAIDCVDFSPLDVKPCTPSPALAANQRADVAAIVGEITCPVNGDPVTCVS